MGHTISRGIGSIKKTVIMASVLENSSVLTEALNYTNDKVAKKKIIHNYLVKTALLNTSSRVNDFPSDLEWMNTTGPLSFEKQLKGKIVLLDFFTYCCINCMHILPELKEIEEEYPVEKGLVVIGVHYAKFTNEKLGANIEAAVHRYEINHPVVNDDQGHMWNELYVHCWPTMVVLAPGGLPVLHLQGEGNKELLLLFIEVLKEVLEEKKDLSDHPIPEIKVTSSLVGIGPLKYPGKVVKNNDKLAISDTGYHRIIIADLAGNVEHVIGGKQSGIKDGTFEEARFHSPQGIAFKNDNILFVADTDNHAIREIDLNSKRVKTVAGTYKQGHDYTGGRLGPKQAISSPWDVCFAGNQDILYIAMAGTHQIWALFLKDSEFWRNRKYTEGTCVNIVGSGREENKNNDYPTSAGLAQPSGLSYSSATDSLYFADSESSAVRAVDLKAGKVSGIVGGALDPKNLFAFGDTDGKGRDVKLQHPLGVAWSAKHNKLYVADSYNHKIKEIDVHSKTCKTLPLKVKFNEPGGLCDGGDALYVADTNNHLIRKVNLDDFSVDIIYIKMPDSLQQKPSFGQNEKSNGITKKTFSIPPAGGSVSLKLVLSLSDNMKISTDGAPSKWTLHLPDSIKCIEQNDDKAFSTEKYFNINVPGGKVNESLSLRAQCKVYICTDVACIPKHYDFHVDLIYSEKVDSTNYTVQQRVEV